MTDEPNPPESTDGTGNDPTQPTPPPQEPFTPSERAVKLHDEYRKKVWEDSVSGSENFDKHLLAFSSGALPAYH